MGERHRRPGPLAHRPRLSQPAGDLGATALPGVPRRRAHHVCPVLVGRPVPSRLQAFVVNEAPALLGCLLTATAIVATMSSLRHPTLGVSTYLVGAASAIALTMLGRAVVNLTIRRARRTGLVRHRSIIVGRGPVAARITDILASTPDYGLQMVGYVADGPPPIPCCRPSPTWEASDPPVGDRHDRCGGHPRGRSGVRRRGALLDRPTGPVERLQHLHRPRLHELSHQVWQSDMIGPIPCAVEPLGRIGVPWKCKRAFDIVVASLALIVLAPLLALCALAVRIDGGPGVLFARSVSVSTVGLRAAEIPVAPAGGRRGVGHDLVHPQRPTVSRLGRLMRRTSLDELPQLWTILRGT